MTKLHKELSNQQKENSNIQNDMKRCQTEMLREEVYFFKFRNNELLHELDYVRQQCDSNTHSKQDRNYYLKY